MKKRKQIISAFAAAACAMMLAITPVAAESTVTVSGQINWAGEPDTDTLRPETVTVSLLADGQQIDRTETSAKENWQFSFAVSPASDAAAYRFYAVVPGYEEDEAARVDPKIEAVPAAIGTWEKYEPCNRLNIPRDVLSDMLIAGKMTQHQALVIWSREPLSAEEQEKVEAAVRTLPGVGNPPSAEFISGDGAEKYGMKISASDGVVQFDDPSQWSLLFGSDYTYGRMEAAEGNLTMRWIPALDPPVDPAPVQPEPEPITPSEDEPETSETPKDPRPSPTVPEKPATDASDTVTAAKTGMPADYYVGVYGFIGSLALTAGLLIWKMRRKTE